MNAQIRLLGFLGLVLGLLVGGHVTHERAGAQWSYDSDPAFAQSFRAANEENRLPTGVRIESIELSQGYSSTAFPESGDQLFFSQAQLGGEIDYGAAATLVWRKSRARQETYLVVQPTYVGRTKFSEWNAANVAASFGVNRRMSSRWTLDFATDVSYIGLEQLLEKTLESGPPASGANTFVLDLGRAFETAASVQSSYRYSRRIELGFHALWSRYQLTSDVPEGNADTRIFLPTSSWAEGGFDLSYMLSPKTTVGFSASLGKSFFRLRDTLVSSQDFFVNRRLSRRWSVAASVGIGKQYGTNVDSVTTVSSNSQLVAAADVEYRRGSHLLAMGIRREVGDRFGVGATTTNSFNGAWRWQPRNGQWQFDAGVNQYKSNVDGFTDSLGWQTRAGASRALNSFTFLRFEYSYFYFSTPFVGLFNNLSRSRVQWSLRFMPQGPGG